MIHKYDKYDAVYHNINHIGFSIFWLKKVQFVDKKKKMDIFLQ